MAFIAKLTLITLLGLILSLHLTVSADQPTNSPASSPVSGDDSISPPPVVPSPSSSPEPSPGFSPAPSPGRSAADEEKFTPTKAPAPAAPSDAELLKNVKADDEGRDGEGMSGGKKAGIAVGVIAAAGLVAATAFVYKKRQQNIRRSEYRINNADIGGF